VFSQWYGSSALIDVVKTILGCTEDELQLGTFFLPMLLQLLLIGERL